MRLSCFRARSRDSRSRGLYDLCSGGCHCPCPDHGVPWAHHSLPTDDPGSANRLGSVPRRTGGMVDYVATVFGLAAWFYNRLVAGGLRSVMVGGPMVPQM
jgi:hypothetical protein